MLLWDVKKYKLMAVKIDNILNSTRETRKIFNTWLFE